MSEESSGLEPKSFFIGLMDFFSILLPGALLVFLLQDTAGPVVLGDERYKALGGPDAGPKAWAAFLVASYLLGHLIFLAGAWLDGFYDWGRRHVQSTQVRLLAREGRLLPPLARGLIWMVFKNEQDLAVSCAGKIKREALGPLQAGNAINTFQWCKAFLTLESPESLAGVQRFEADSKFFRSFVVVLLLLIVGWPLQHRWAWRGIGVAAGLLLLALWRYMEQRHKATNQAYWSVITLTARSGKIVFPKAAPAGPTHAGGVVFRMRGEHTEYLLVEASDTPGVWVLPKGHIEAGENPRETAVREVREETGVWARIEAPLESTQFNVQGRSITVAFHLMETLAEGKSQERRKKAWLPLAKAFETALHPESKSLLQQAEAERSKRSGECQINHPGRS